MIIRRQHILARRALVGALLALLLPSFAFAAADKPVRQGPDFAERWRLAVKDLGSIEIFGRLDAARSPGAVVGGRFGAGALVLAFRPDDSPRGLWQSVVRFDGREIEIEERLSGWVMRRSAAEATMFVMEEADLFGIAVPATTPFFLGEEPGGVQRWEYGVEGGARYRVWLRDQPLRLVRRDFITAEGLHRTTLFYDDFLAISNRLALPRHVMITTPGGEPLMELIAERLAVRPPLPPLPPDRRDSAMCRAGEALMADSGFLSVTQLAAAWPPASRGRLYSGLAALDRLEAEYGPHPLLDCQRARFALNLGDTRLAGIAIRAALPLGRVVLPLAAQVGAMELRASGDSQLLNWTVNAAAPAAPERLIDAESLLFGVVVEIAVEAWVADSRPAWAEEIVRRAFILDPLNSRIVDAAMSLALARGDETGALAVGYRQVSVRPADLQLRLQQSARLEQLGRLAEAESFLVRSCEQLPGEPTLYLRLGLVQLARKRWIEAEATFDGLMLWMERSGLSAERRADLCNEIACAYAEYNIALAKARMLINFALAVNPRDPYYLDTLGMIHWRSRNRIAAIMTFERALAIQNDPRIREHLERARR